jgi:hypothetical protein
MHPSSPPSPLELEDDADELDDDELLVAELLADELLADELVADVAVEPFEVELLEAAAGAPPAPVPDADATITVLPHAEITSAGVKVRIATKAAEDFIAASAIVPGGAATV